MVVRSHRPGNKIRQGLHLWEFFDGRARPKWIAGAGIVLN
jgi:hypothetical protein